MKPRPIPVLLAAALLAGAAENAWAAPPEYVWVTNRAAGAAGGVGIYTTANVPVVELQGAAYAFNRPYGIVHAPAHGLVAVANSGAVPGTVTLIDASTYAAIQVLNGPAGSLNFTEMVLSPDGQSAFIAGQDAQGPSVFQVNFGARTIVRVGGVIDPGRAAADVEVIRASNAGGSGNGPGRLYFTVTNGGPNGYIGEINLLTGGTFRSLDLGSGPIVNTRLPTQLVRRADHAGVYVCCTTNGVVGVQWVLLNPALNIDTAGAAQQIQLTDTVQILPHIVYDASIGDDARGFVLFARDSGSPELQEFNPGTGQTPLGTNPRNVTASQVNVTYNVALSDVFMGSSSDTDSNYYTSDVAGTQPGPVAITSQAGFGLNGATRFAFVPVPGAPSIRDLRYSGSLPGGLVTVKGSNFNAGSVVQVNPGAGRFGLPTTVLDSGTLVADASALVPGSLYHVIVVNPDLQESEVRSYVQALPAAPVAPDFTVPLPASAEGYALRSFPQYATLSDLRAALEAQLGPYNPAFYRVWFHRDGRYVELNRATDDQAGDLMGRGFFVLTRLGGSLTLAAPDVAANTPGGQRVVILQPGWNIVGQPIVNGVNRTILYSDLLFTQDPLLVSGIQTADSAPALLSTQPWEYVNRTYVRTDRMTAGRAYWLFNLGSSPLYLIFNQSDVALLNEVPPPGAGGGGTKLSAVPSSEPPPPAAPGDGVADGDGSGDGSCGLLGAEVLVLLAALRRRRRAAARA